MAIRKINQLEWKRLCLARQNYHYIFFEVDSTLMGEPNDCRVLIKDSLSTVCILGCNAAISNCIEVITALNISWYEKIPIKDLASIGLLSAINLRCIDDYTLEISCKGATARSILTAGTNGLSIIINDVKAAVARSLQTAANVTYLFEHNNAQAAIAEATSICAKLLITSGEIDGEMIAEPGSAISTAVECYNIILNDLLLAAIVDFANPLSTSSTKNIELCMELKMLLGRLATLADWGDNSLNELNNLTLDDLKVYVEGE